MKKSHLKIHFFYIIVILAAICIGQASVSFSSNKSLVELLSFAIGLTSLILAMIAIIQNIVASPQMQQSVTQLAEVAQTIRINTESLGEATKDIVSHLAPIKILPQQIQVLQSKVQDALDAKAGYEKPVPSQIPEHLKVVVSSPAAAVAQYFLGQTIQHGGNADPFAVFPTESGPLGGIVAGYATSLNDLAFLSFEFRDGFQNMKTTNPLPVTTLLGAIEGRSDSIALSSKAAIDLYFAKKASDVAANI